MLTAAWSSYTGPSRIAVSPVPLIGVARGYRRHPRLSLARPVMLAVLRRHLATFDARMVAAELVASYRSELAKWFTFAGVHVAELDP